MLPLDYSEIKVLARQLESMACSTTEYIPINQSHSASKNSYHLDETCSMWIDTNLKKIKLYERKVEVKTLSYSSLNWMTIKRPR